MEEGLGIVERIYRRALSLDPELLDALGEIAAPNAEFDFTDAYPDGKRVRGVDGVRRLAANWPWQGLRFEPERILEREGGRVLVFVRATATGEGSGVAVERRTAHECTFEDDVLVRFKVYSDRDQALAATPATPDPTRYAGRSRTTSRAGLSSRSPR
jgi:hypothetical protein